MSSNKELVRESTREVLTFHWSYVVLPVAILLLSIILFLVFYSRLSDELAFRFNTDGSAVAKAGRSTVLLWTLLPQLLFALVAAVITWGMTGLVARFIEPGSIVVKPERIILIMGNMLALPQSILCFAMLDIFSYNSYQIHLFPVWIFAVIVMVLGGIILGIFSFRVIRQVWKVNKE